ncbi:uncharacterized protein BJ171DRAFT_156820 [Polychytrium aggregatum]|uniref:uncharacterized protein n=1 Tax=Polychytrium aggregatum TaxID=110093 RepID=UPI0022FDC13E|nr:uncharacterized protein BJ171DRAFT_156820 [Polychytrium aggregatum]KAI9202922.1 hypothetical protein BJ171DRAFT_156820 [Polychytrium aggregatum]
MVRLSSASLAVLGLVFLSTGAVHAQNSSSTSVAPPPPTSSAPPPPPPPTSDVPSSTIQTTTTTTTTTTNPPSSTTHSKTTTVASSTSSLSVVTTQLTQAPTTATTTTNNGPITQGPPVGPGSTTSSASTATPSGNGSPPPTDNSGSNLGAIVGGIAGGVVAVALIAAAGGYIYTRRKYQNKDRDLPVYGSALPPPQVSNSWKPLDEPNNYGSPVIGPPQNAYGVPPMSPQSNFGGYPPQSDYGRVASPQPNYAFNQPPPTSNSPIPPLSSQPNIDDSPQRFSSLDRYRSNAASAPAPVSVPATTSAPAIPIPQPPVNTNGPKPQRRFVRVARNAENPDELSMIKDEELVLLETYEDGWGLAENTTGSRGVVPLNFLSEPAQADVRTVIRARFAVQSDELTLNANEKLTVVEVYDDGWGLVENSHGEQGMAPLNFLA